MTYPYNSLKRPKLLIIHGLNNNLEGFDPLRKEFQNKGYSCQLITLPGHGENRNESRDFTTAFAAFDKQFKHHSQEPYVVIAFSQGALYLQLWLEHTQNKRPLGQVLLAPALYVNQQSKIELLIKMLPSFSFIISQTPKKLKKYFKLFIWEYRTLFEAIRKYQLMQVQITIPTLVMIDPRDELINAKVLNEKLIARDGVMLDFRFIDRPNIKAPGLGKHHVLFHPDYFDEKEWSHFIDEIAVFLASAEA